MNLVAPEVEIHVLASADVLTASCETTAAQMSIDIFCPPELPYDS